MSSPFKLGDNRYGKENVRLLRVVRDSARHEVHELKAQILLEGSFDESFTTGSNKMIVATETQKNRLYYFAKKFPLDSIEKWAQDVSSEMMSTFSHISAVCMDIDELLWDRIQVPDSNGRLKEHNHAFKKASNGTRFCSTRITRNGGLASMTSGFKDLQVLKTTQSGFEGYIKDEFTTLGETNDRVLATKIQCSWKFSNDKISGISAKRYSEIFDGVQKITLEVFAGDPEKGTYSPSVQQTVYDIGCAVLKKFPELEKISFVLPNIHYYFVDFKQFRTTLANNKEVFFTFDGASGHIEGTVERNNNNKIKSNL